MSSPSISRNMILIKGTAELVGPAAGKYYVIGIQPDDTPSLQFGAAEPYIERDLPYPGNIANGYLAKYDVNNNAIWVAQFGGEEVSGDEAGTNPSVVATYSDGSVLVAGYWFGDFLHLFNGDGSDSGTTLENELSPFSGAMFYAKYDADGELLWARTSQGNRVDPNPTGVAITSDGTAIITGVASWDQGGPGLVRFGAGEAEETDSPNYTAPNAFGSQFYWTIKVDTDGNLLSAKFDMQTADSVQMAGIINVYHGNEWTPHNSVLIDEAGDAYYTAQVVKVVTSAASFRWGVGEDNETTFTSGTHLNAHNTYNAFLIKRNLTDDTVEWVARAFGPSIDNATNTQDPRIMWSGNKILVVSTGPGGAGSTYSFNAGTFNVPTLTLDHVDNRTGLLSVLVDASGTVSDLAIEENASNSQYVIDLTRDSDGVIPTILATGGTVRLAQGTAEEITYSDLNPNGMVFAKYDSDHVLQWSKRSLWNDDSPNAEVTGFVADSIPEDNDLVIAGFYEGLPRFGSEEDNQTDLPVSDSGVWKGFISHFDPVTGELISARQDPRPVSASSAEGGWNIAIAYVEEGLPVPDTTAPELATTVSATPVLHLILDETSGSTLVNSVSPGTLDGTPGGSLNIPTDNAAGPLVGQTAIETDADGEHIRVPANAAWKSTALTFAGLVRVPFTQGHPADFMSCYQYGGTVGHGVKLWIDGAIWKMRIANNDAGPPQVWDASANGAFPIATWHHVAGVVEEDGTVTLYINGVAQTSVGTSAVVSTDDPINYPLLVFNSHGGGGEEGHAGGSWYGRARHVMAWDVALDPADILALATVCLAGDTPTYP